MEATGQGTIASPLRLPMAGGVPLIQMVYPMPEAGHPDEAALLVLSRVLSTGRRSRLTQQLVEGERPLAGTVDGLLFQGVDQGWYQLVVEALPEVGLREIQSQILGTVEGVRSRPISAAELERAQGLVRSQILLEGRDVTSQGMQLGQDCLILADCDYRDRLLERVEAVTPARVQQVARRYLTEEQATVGWLELTEEIAGVGTDPSSDFGLWNRRSRLQRPHNNGHGGGLYTDGDYGKADGQLDGAAVDALVQQYLPTVGTSPQPLAIAPQVVTLPNGLQVLLVRDDSTPTVTVAGYIPAGRQWDPMDRAGLAELVATGLWGGSGDRSEAELAQTLESKGIQLEFQPHREGVMISGQALADQEQAVVELLGDLLQRPQFNPAALDRDRQRALGTLQNRLENPSYVARKRAQELMYPAGHPFRIFPTAKTLEAITRQDLQQFHQTHYRPNGTVLALIGDIDPGRLRQTIEAAFESWQRSPEPHLQSPRPSPPQQLQYLHKTITTKSQAITVMGYPGITRTDPRYYPALILNQILGGDTLASRLGRTLRDHYGLTYGVYSQFQAGQQAGPFSIDFQTHPQDVETAIRLTRQELQALRQGGVSEEEVRAAQNALVRSYPVTLADPDILAEHLVMGWVHGYDLDELTHFGDRINRVSPAAVNQVIQQLIHPDQLAIVTAGPPRAAKF